MMKKIFFVCACFALLDSTIAKGVIDVEGFVEEQDPRLTSGFSCKGQKNGLYQDPNDCSGFINCWDGRIFFQKCPKGLNFNPKTKYCDWPENVTCPDFCASRPDGIYPDPETCKGFIHCHNNRTARKNCPTGTLFNPKLKVCDWPHNVDCPTEPGSGDFM
ncbi:chitin-binding domain protein cbd-1-like [Actinia tenebrosa]|uniref:Chitin-binding domain protein cbd-1-like n=1 Tax=Actinia tenebrosa TaxID=6105 RepID=A0A6P8J5N5_ACTTE|nr:chitin-binding domain protein cbd-1-like [Actinia tenebrosa]